MKHTVSGRVETRRILHDIVLAAKAMVVWSAMIPNVVNLDPQQDNYCAEYNQATWLQGIG